MTVLSRQVNLASWAYQTNITDANEAAMLEQQAVWGDRTSRALVDAEPFFAEMDTYSPDTHRKLSILKLWGGEPKDSDERSRLQQLLAAMNSAYATARYDGKPLNPDLEQIMAQSRDYDELLDAW